MAREYKTGHIPVMKQNGTTLFRFRQVENTNRHSCILTETELTHPLLRRENKGFSQPYWMPGTLPFQCASPPHIYQITMCMYQTP